MIVFDLLCGDAGHVFEAWFGSTEDYDAQQARGLVSCPICGSPRVDKAPMTPRLGARGNRAADPPRTAPVPNRSPAAIKAMLQTLAEQQSRMLETSEHVGERFADEARAIHLGEGEPRSIHGQATPAEARSLNEEGIAVAPLPFPIRPPGTDN